MRAARSSAVLCSAGLAGKPAIPFFGRAARPDWVPGRPSIPGAPAATRPAINPVVCPLARLLTERPSSISFCKTVLGTTSVPLAGPDMLPLGVSTAAAAAQSARQDSSAAAPNALQYAISILHN